MISPRDILVLSIRQVFRQKRRNFGVVLAIALGIAGLIAILSMGDEVKKNLNRDLDLLGGVQQPNTAGHGQGSRGGQAPGRTG